MSEHILSILCAECSLLVFVVILLQAKSSSVYTILKVFFYVYKCFARVFVCALHWCLVPVEARSRSPGTVVMDGCGLPCGC